MRRIEARGRRARARRSTSRSSTRSSTRGHEERIERVIGHVVQNALDATRARRTRSGSGCAAAAARRWSRSATPAAACRRNTCRPRCSSPSRRPRRRAWASAPTRATSTCTSWAATSPSTASRAGARVMTIAAAAVRVAPGVGSADVERQMNADKLPPLLIVEDDLALQKQIKWSLDRFESRHRGRPRKRARCNAAGTPRPWSRWTWACRPIRIRCRKASGCSSRCSASIPTSRSSC